jgi:hypothetical protein
MFSDKDILTVFHAINMEFFDGQLPAPGIVPASDDCTDLAYYNSGENAISQCCKMLAWVFSHLSVFSHIPIPDKNLMYADPINVFISLIEHEIVHYLVSLWYNHDFAREKRVQRSAHGYMFIHLVYNLFHHGWGDIAMAHLPKYVMSGGKDPNFQDSQHDSTYRREVLERLETVDVQPIQRALAAIARSNEYTRRSRSPIRSIRSNDRPARSRSRSRFGRGRKNKKGGKHQKK